MDGRIGFVAVHTATGHSDGGFAADGDVVGFVIVMDVYSNPALGEVSEVADRGDDLVSAPEELSYAVGLVCVSTILSLVTMPLLILLMGG